MAWLGPCPHSGELLLTQNGAGGKRRGGRNRGKVGVGGERAVKRQDREKQPASLRQKRGDQHSEPGRTGGASERDTSPRHEFSNDSFLRCFWGASEVLSPRLLRTRPAAGRGSLAPTPSLSPPHLSQGGRNGFGARGLFGPVEWKIDFNPLCGNQGARSALPGRDSGRSGGPPSRPGLESLQSSRHEDLLASGRRDALPGSAHPGQAALTKPGSSEEADRLLAVHGQGAGPSLPPPTSALLGLDAVFLRPGRPWWKSLLSTGSPSQLPSHPQRISARNGNWLEQTSPLLRVREWKVRVGGSQATATVPVPGWPVCLLGGS